MMASWVALEDIHEGSGELKYIPGSHRLTYLPLGDSQDFIFAGAKPEDIEAHTKDMWDQIRPPEATAIPVFDPEVVPVVGDNLSAWRPMVTRLFF
jgi:hypothetical protein